MANEIIQLQGSHKMHFVPMKKQKEAMRFLLQNPRSGLFMRMGTGKTITTLSVIQILMYQLAMLRRVLLIAPLRVAEMTWADEIAKWAHTRGLTYSFIHGTEKGRDLVAAKNSDIVAINFEGLQWLEQNKKLFHHFDMLLVDESTWIKNPTAVRTKILHKLARFIPRIHILSGGPAPNGLMDLWSQIYLLDRGARLGPNITAYRGSYFFKSDHQRGYYLATGSKKKIVDLIADIVMVVDQEDQEGIPPVHNNVVNIPLPKKLEKQYCQLESEFFTTLNCGHVIETHSSSEQQQKLRQFLSGFVYTSPSTMVQVHQERLKVLKELTESLSGRNLLVAIQYREEVREIQKYFKKDIPFINSESKKSQDQVTLRLWMAGKLPMLLANPGSIGHGLNLQAGGSDIVWYSLTWNLEQWEQFIARLARMAQKSAKVMNHILIMKGTMDEVIFNAVNRKDATQQSVMTALKEWRENASKRNGKAHRTR